MRAIPVVGSFGNTLKWKLVSASFVRRDYGWGGWEGEINIQWRFRGDSANGTEMRSWMGRSELS